jgi:predicted permease
VKLADGKARTVERVTMESLLKDIRYAVRISIKRPGLTITAILSLALGIGANTAIFSVVDRVMLRSLPVDHPEQLVTVAGRNPRGLNTSFSYPNFKDLRDNNDVLSAMIATADTPLSLSEGGRTDRGYGVLVTGNYFDALGVKPLIGRTFATDEDATQGTHPVVVLNYGYWQRRFGGDPGIVNRSLLVNGHGFTIIGVTGREFNGTTLGTIPDVYLPMMMQTAAMPKWTGALDKPFMSWLDVMGRLKPGVSIEQAQASLTILSSGLAEANPDLVDPEIVLQAAPRGNASSVADLSTPLLLLLSTVALVLIIACANVANLLLARGAGRSREIAVRLAVGATRRRLIKQLLTESILLSVAGGAAALLLASWLMDLLLTFRPTATSFLLPALDVRLDARILGFTAAISLITGVLFGLAPALQASRPDLIEALKDESGSVTAGGRRAVIRNALVVGQVALSVVILISAGLCIRSLNRLNAIDAGFDTERVMVAPVDLALNGYKEDAGREFYRTLLDRARTLPGVESASVARILPLGSNGMRITAKLEDYVPGPGENVNLDFNIVGPGYFETMSVPLLAGRAFSTTDDRGSRLVAVVNETLAKTYFGDRDPIGLHITLGGFPGQPEQRLEIVGLVKDTKYRSLTEGQRAIMFLPYLQHYRPDLALHLRTIGPSTAVAAAAVRNEIQQMDSTLPVARIRTLEEQKGSSLFRERMAAMFLASFGALALLLATIGIYGVMAFAVSRRTREIGIRMALGAQVTDVLKLVLRQGGLLVVLGVAIGAGGAYFATRLLEGFLYGVAPHDTTTFVVVPILLALAALAACLLPARRATKVDPIEALRCQ